LTPLREERLPALRDLTLILLPSMAMTWRERMPENQYSVKTKWDSLTVVDVDELAGGSDLDNVFLEG
jgi:hypothetical protein